MKRQVLTALATVAMVAAATTSARTAAAAEVYRTAGLNGGVAVTEVAYRPYYRAYRPYGVYRPYVAPYAYPYRAYRPYVAPYRPYAYPYRAWRGPARYWW